MKRAPILILTTRATVDDITESHALGIDMKNRAVRGVQFLVDEAGQKTAVLIDLKKNSGLWEDIYDAALARERETEPRESLQEVKARLQQAGKLPRGR